MSTNHPSDSRIAVEGASTSNTTVSGIPFIPVYAPPVGHTYGQLQFPPPMNPASYIQYGAEGAQVKAGYPQLPVSPPPPSIYYSRYPVPVIPSGHYGYPQSHNSAPIIAQVGSNNLRSMQPANYNAGEVYTLAFNEESVRSSFTKQVMLLLLIQFLVSTVLSAICLEWETVQEDIVEEYPWLLWLSLATGLMVMLFSKLKLKAARKRPTDVYLFLIWSLALIVTLVWVTALLEAKFLVIMQLLLAVQIGTLFILSALRRTSFLTGRSMLVSGFVLLIVAIAVAVFYAHGAAVVFFAIFTSMLVLLYFLFRLHYLMGDEWRQLQPHEVLTGATSIFF